MNAAEFREWFAHHGQLFPEVQSWLNRLDAKAGNVSAAGILGKWREIVLLDVELLNAIEASNLLARGEEALPKVFSEHARTVRAIAKRRGAARESGQRTRALFIDGEPTIACLECQDTGWRTVWHPKSVVAAQEGKLRSQENPDGTPAYSCAVACRCKAGDARLNACGHRYDPARMCLWTIGLECDKLAALYGWLEERQTKAYAWNPDDSGHEGF